MGNTCYLNATVQCLKMISELPIAIKQYFYLLIIRSGLSITADSHDNFSVSLSSLLNELKSSGSSIQVILNLMIAFFIYSTTSHLISPVCRTG